MSDAIELSEDTQKGLAQRLGDVLTGAMGSLLRKADDDDKASTDENYMTDERFQELMEPIQESITELKDQLAELAAKGVELTAEQLEQLEAGAEAEEGAEAEGETATEPQAAEPVEEPEPAAALKHEVATAIAGSNLADGEKVRLAKSALGKIDVLSKSIDELRDGLDEHNRTQHAGKTAALESEALEKGAPGVEWDDVLT